jgi:UDP-glucose 4-epimerase
MSETAANARGGGVLVSGGAGYIGSHVALALAEGGEQVTTYDDLSTGHRSAVLHGDLVVGDVGDRELLLKTLRERRVDTVMHFAARIVVPDSVKDPLQYYGNNTCATRNLLECCRDAGVRHVVFSSTAAVYGDPPGGHADEDTPVAPASPYGRSKLMSEWMLQDLAATGALTYVALRYFNVAGADSKGRIGQSFPAATHLIKVACQAAIGQRESVAVMGTDYPTPDGTGVRDYIHIEDLATAHVLAMKYLRAGGESATLNCGYGHGSSVREVLKAVERAAGKPLPVVEGPRREGDVATVVAKADRLRAKLGWSPQHDDLDRIVQSALAWERRLAASPP